MTSHVLAWICKYELSYAMCYTVTANPKICKYVMAISIDRLWLLWLCLDCTACFPQGMQITSGRHNLNILATAYKVYSIVYFKRIQENPRNYNGLLKNTPACVLLRTALSWYKVWKHSLYYIHVPQRQVSVTCHHKSVSSCNNILWW